jgi:HJR/Mrr/RecB family endonuclease
MAAFFIVCFFLSLYPQRLEESFAPRSYLTALIEETVQRKHYMSSFSETQQQAWSSLQAVFDEILVKVEEWKESVDEGSLESTEALYALDLEDLEAEKPLGLGEDVYFAHELGETIDTISAKVDGQDLKELPELFGELSSTCFQANINIEEESERIENHLEVLNAAEGRLIYVPKTNLIYAPEILLEVNDEVIKRIARDPESIFAISPRKFEEIIAELFIDRGFEVELTKSTRDGGRDIIAIHKQMNVPTKYLIECKRYARTNKVSIATVQRLFGVKVAEAANKAILATTSTFTRDARHFASTHMWDLDLKDYDDIMAWIKVYGR